MGSSLTDVDLRVLNAVDEYASATTTSSLNQRLGYGEQIIERALSILVAHGLVRASTIERSRVVWYRTTAAGRLELASARVHRPGALRWRRTPRKLAGQLALDVYAR